MLGIAHMNVSGLIGGDTRQCTALANDDTFQYGKLKSGMPVQYGPVCGYDFELMRHIGFDAAKRTGNSCSLYSDFSVPHKLLLPVPTTAPVVNLCEVSAVVL